MVTAPLSRPATTPRANFSSQACFPSPPPPRWQHTKRSQYNSPSQFYQPRFPNKRNHPPCQICSRQNHSTDNCYFNSNSQKRHPPPPPPQHSQYYQRSHPRQSRDQQAVKQAVHQFYQQQNANSKNE